MLRDIVEKCKAGGGRYETVTIYCPYCHQGMAADATMDMIKNEDMLKELAVETCSCPEAQFEAKRKHRAESVDEKVNKMLGESSDTSVDSSILELIKQMSIHICYKRLKKMSINIDSRTKVSISTDANDLLDIKKEIKDVSRQKI